MPIEIPDEKTAPVYYPQSNYKIVRYLDLVKFLSLLQTKKIFFARLDTFEDKYEGTIPYLTKFEYKEWYKNFAQHRLLDILKTSIEEHVEKEMKDEEDARNQYRKLVCVSCWNKYNSESYALWKIYSDLSKGVMISSDIEKIVNAFKITKENIQISEVRYIDFKTERMPMGNMNYPIIHKNIHYDYEKEIRLIHTVNLDKGWIYDWKSEENEFGKYIDIDINELIDEIIISPNSPKWFFNLIENLCKTYNLKKIIRYSDLR
ncbi:hypothetical protein [Chryseobacterium fistulae]|uniref:DUF2971 domain-containing protein n=1 Tax=Chryseobacterium fistulae TaxID=2675058 RepID=A0A6N4XPT6_9FLAO|nr:hypothetical protein [Chryseobacterium fistulae]CAA7389592.1 hypothetical protein CHRY9393_02175 [Chryseobacterium fistulae]